MSASTSEHLSVLARDAVAVGAIMSGRSQEARIGALAGDGTAVLEGTTVKLKQEAADLLNKTFGITALKGGLVIGVAKITINTK